MTPTPGLTRRHFLHRAASTSLALPLIVPGTALGKDGKARDSGLRLIQNRSRCVEPPGTP